MIFIPDPAEGSYELAIVGAKAGTYSCKFVSQDSKVMRKPAELKDVSIGADEKQVFLVRFSEKGGSQIQVKKK